jgi:hypothetical protein
MGRDIDVSAQKGWNEALWLFEVRSKTVDKDIDVDAHKVLLQLAGQRETSNN